MTTEERARAEFGLTQNPLLAGYILADGDMLDFSHGSAQRIRDHREINRALGSIPGEETGWEQIRRFLRITGAIRLNLWCHITLGYAADEYGMSLHRVKPATSAQVLTVVAIMRALNVTYAEVSISPPRREGGTTTTDLEDPVPWRVRALLQDA